MKRLSMLAVLLFAPLTFAESKPANPEAAASPAEELVQRTLVKPLASKEREKSRFSRGRMPAQARRVRILDEQKDARGATFVRFAIDARHGFADADEAKWRKDTITGCAYVDRGEVFVKKGDEYRPAAFLLGKNLKAAAAPICHTASEIAQAD